jgi:hypothetical protein
MLYTFSSGVPFVFVGCTFLVVVFGATDIKSVDQNI